MNNQNVKIYLIISGILLLIFLILIFYPVNKKTTQLNEKQSSLPMPTSVEINIENNRQNNNQPLIISPAEFTGVLENEPPDNIKNQALEKQNLRNLTPYDSGLFKIDFDYNEDKFVVYLNEPKQENKSEFLKWLKNNFPNLPENQFNFR